MPSKLLVLFIISLNICPQLSAQSVGDPLISQDTRKSSLYLGVGLLELVAIGYQYQINEHYALGAKLSSALPKAGLLGIKGSYYFHRNGENKFLWSNVVNFELTYGGMFWKKLDGLEMEMTFGHDSIERNHFGVLFLAGASYGIARGFRPWYFVALKLGVHYNL